MSAQPGLPGADLRASSSQRFLVCFAVKEEAGPFRKLWTHPTIPEVLVTGMGQTNAAKSIEGAFKSIPPALVLTCGFAGALKPGLKTGTVLCSTEPLAGPSLASILQCAGALPGRFVLSRNVATTVSEKQALWKQSQADAVEMESGVITEFCTRHHIPSATVRVVLDVAEADLPLDFNKFMTPDQRMDFVKLTLFLLKSPGKLPALLALQKQSRAAAEKLASVLISALRQLMQG